MKQSKPALLFLVHRIPYPPNKGDKIRSFNMLKALSVDYKVHLGTFIDDPNDNQYVNKLSDWCDSVLAIEQRSLWAKIKGLVGFVTNQAISVPYYGDRGLSNWVKRKVEQENIERCLVFSGAMAQFVEPLTDLLENTVVDFVDVDSDKWSQYASNKQGIKSWFYQREARLLAKYEVSIAQRTRASCFVSDDEASMFKTMLPSKEHQKVFGIRNGVDTAYFDPDAAFTELPNVSKYSLAFTGAMDYWANVNAVLWFVDNVWPAIIKQHKEATFYVVGSKPSNEILALNGKNNIVITGRVEDVRPYIAKTTLSIAPLQIARGIQNKVLEALSMARPIVLTSMASEGINDVSHPGYWIEDDATAMANRIVQVLKEDFNNKFPTNREYVKSHFSWDTEMSKFRDLIEHGVRQ